MGLAGRGQDPTDPVRDDLDAEREAAESCIYLQELPQAAGSLPAASLLRRLSRLDLPDQCLLEFFFFSFFFIFYFPPSLVQPVPFAGFPCRPNRWAPGLQEELAVPPSLPLLHLHLNLLGKKK